MSERITPRRRLAALVAAAAVFGASLLGAPAAMAAPATYGALTITADPAVTAGDTVTVTVTADTVADLFAYDLVIGFDPAQFAFDAASASFPTGGFDSVATDTGTVTFTNTRLGTSPGLTGPQTLVTFMFTSLAAGDADITLVSGTFVGTAGESDPIATGLPGMTTTTVVAAAPTATPTLTPTPTTTPSPTTTASIPLVGSPASGAGGSMASTGIDATPWLIAGGCAVVLVALGLVLIIRRQGATR